MIKDEQMLQRDVVKYFNHTHETGSAYMKMMDNDNANIDMQLSPTTPTGVFQHPIKKEAESKKYSRQNPMTSIGGIAKATLLEVAILSRFIFEICEKGKNDRNPTMAKLASPRERDRPDR